MTTHRLFIGRLPRPRDASVCPLDNGGLIGVRQNSRLKQLAKICNRQTPILNNPAHRIGIHWVVAGNGHYALTICHDNVLSLTCNAETGFLQCAHGVEVIDAGNFRQD